MQKTRERIVNILKMRGEATVEELSEELGLTSVTVRHHMEILRSEGIVGPPVPLRRDQPGRPQYLYRLARGAEELFPNNYDFLAASLLQEMGKTFPPEQIDVVLKRIAEKVAAQADVGDEPGSLASLNTIVNYLNSQGYMVTKEFDRGHVTLQFHNCPYKRIAGSCCEVCEMDSHMLTELFLGEPTRKTSIVEGDSSCTYVLPDIWNRAAEEAAL
jgi:predicted ArsR family transcriptional regulator